MPAEITVKIAPGTNMGSAVRALSEAAHAAGLRGECAFLWGSVPAIPSLRSATVQLPDEIRGWMACGADMDAAAGFCQPPATVCNPRLRHAGMVGYRDGRLMATHPADTSETDELDPTLEIPFRQPNEDVLLAVVPGDGAPAVPFLTKLKVLAPGYVAMLLLDTAAPAPAPTSAATPGAISP